MLGRTLSRGRPRCSHPQQETEAVVAAAAPYMAPEQLCGHKTDARSDTYPAGAALDETANARRPFHGTPGPDLMAAITPSHFLLTTLVLAALLGSRPCGAKEPYFPPPDSQGGWRHLENPAEIRRLTGVDKDRLDRAFDFLQRTSKHGGLLVARHGWLVYERYFGRGHREATPNNASIGKSFTSVAAGILISERPDLFPQGLDQKVFTDAYLPPVVFPLTDARKAEIKLGHLLAMTSGIRGNNPGVVLGEEVTLDPAGPDGWLACSDDMAAGRTQGVLNTTTLWCAPGGGYSYATSSPHLVSMMIRHVTGKELDRYVREKVARPLGWGRWGWGYKNRPLQHTCGGGGIALRPTDMLRFAYLLLREGRWADRQLVPADYVRNCGRPSRYNPHFDYSLQFHVNGNGRWQELPRDAFWKGGSGGHSIYVIPSLDLVIYKMGGRDEQYDPANTGVPPPPGAAFKYDGSRDNWRAGTAPSFEEMEVGTLRQVLAAIQK